VPDTAAEDLHRLGGVPALVGGEVHGRVEGAAAQEAGEVLAGAVTGESLHPRAEGIGQPAAVEERHLVAPGEEPPGEVVSEEAGSADEEDLQRSADGPAA